MPDRRAFLASASLAGAATLLHPARAAARLGGGFLEPTAIDGVLHAFATETRPPPEAAGDEDLWREVQQAFTVDRSMVNLNNGGVSPAPAVVQEAMQRYLAFSNEAPVYTMWRVLEPQKEGIRQRLALDFGCDAEEIAITRNASESLQILQLGFDLEPGDEVLTTDQDYPRMLTTFAQRVRREGIVLRTFPLPVPAEDPAEIVRRFEEQITPRTRLILMCHMINITGQILPVREVVEMARRRGIPVIVDGAHAYAHFAFRQADLGCDFYASSLHKWLFAPFGTGLLHVRRERISELWPLMASPETLDADIRKFEEIGTHPCPNYLAIGAALTFHQGIGVERKEARLVHLRDYWANELLQEDGVRLNTSLRPGFAAGIANVAIEGVEPAELTAHLWRRHRIIVTPIGHPDCPGIRVSPSVYTTKEELNRFIDAMRGVVRHGLLIAIALLAGCEAPPPPEDPGPERRVIATEGAPAAIGPYSQAIQVGNTLYLAGQIALDPVTGEVVEGGIEAETHRVMQNLSAVLEAAGFTFGDVVQSQVFLADLDEFGVMNEIYGSYLDETFPTRATVEVARIPRDGRVEIVMTAVRLP